MAFLLLSKGYKWNNSPRNLVSSKPYRGVNVFILQSAGYDSPYWLTFKQIEDLGGSIKGQRSEMVVFWKLLEKPVENRTEENKRDYIPMLRYYRVFNLDQVEGIEKPTAENVPPFQPIVDAAVGFLARKTCLYADAVTARPPWSVPWDAAAL